MDSNGIRPQKKERLQDMKACNLYAAIDKIVVAVNNYKSALYDLRHWHRLRKASPDLGQLPHFTLPRGNDISAIDAAKIRTFFELQTF